MIKKKTKAEIELMRQGGILLSNALEAAAHAVRPGVTTLELDKIAQEILQDGGGEPAFLNYKGPHDQIPFPSALCTSVNDEVVHGPATRNLVLKEGDIVGLDLGCKYKGMYTDMAVTVPVGQIDEPAKKLIKVTEQSLQEAIKAVGPGRMISEIGEAVEKSVAPSGFGIVRALVGHGVGHGVHEEPRVPNFIDPHCPKVKMQPGMCLAIEPMITEGDFAISSLEDGWTVATADGKLSAHFEVTVAVTKDGVEVITPFIEL